jgi:uncharacterized membrane protein YgdD (TMEM256/DUF423 family)
MNAPAILFRVGALLAAVSVAAGAFGAHALAERLSPERLETWRTASHYLMVHSVAIAALAAAARSSAQPMWCLWLLVAGCIVFSGSLYALCLTDVRILGAITPIGGLAFIAGWIALALTWRWH